MATRPKSNLTVEQFLEAYKDLKGYELVEGEVLKMAAESNRHGMLKGNSYYAIRQAIKLAGLDCFAMPDGVSIKINEKTAREPDVSVQCGRAPEANSLLLESPVIVVEVVSPASARRDESEKLGEYFSVPSIMHYLIVWPKQKYCFHHQRIDDNKVLTTIVRTGTIELAPPGITISVEEIFGEVDR
jgi:Uma2 family endonuclease